MQLIGEFDGNAQEDKEDNCLHVNKVQNKMFVVSLKK